MSTIFLSHASKDDALADGFVGWLTESGFSDPFIDHKSIDGGEKRDDALTRAAGACRAVVCLVPDDWLASIECFSEFRVARYTGKRVLPLILTAEPAANGEPHERWRRVIAEDQGIDLRAIRDGDALAFDRDEGVAERRPWRALRRVCSPSGILGHLG